MTTATSTQSAVADERDVLANPHRYRMLTGDRPTGPLHLGHYLGTLQNRVRLQDAGVATFVVIADYQVITDRDDPGDIRANVGELVLDYLAAGIDPERTTIFSHSAVPALNQLMLPFLAVMTVSELRRNPTVKAEATSAGIRSISGLLLTYPVHQAADILFCGGNLVPVGHDQLPHVEAARMVARQFNQRFAHGAEIFTEPQALLSQSPRLPGIDGQKMSKSRGNVIALGAGEDETARALRRTVTDSERTITYEPEHRPGIAGLLEVCASFEGTSPGALAEQLGDAGAAALKSRATEAVNDHLRAFRSRRAELAGDPSIVPAVLRSGAEHASEIAEQTLRTVNEVLGMTYADPLR